VERARRTIGFLTGSLAAASHSLPMGVFWEADILRERSKLLIFLVSAPGLEPGTT
jgi:hypothetical protein